MDLRRNAALVLEGGALRGIFTAGVLDFLMERGESFDYIVGVSAGACNAASFISRQKGRSRDCILTQGEDSFYGLQQFRRSKKILDYDKLFFKYSTDTYPFDFEGYAASDVKSEYVVTNCSTGKPEYLSEREDLTRFLSLLRASSTLPLISSPFPLDGQDYLDGGLSDPIPVLHALNQGYSKALVVLTKGPDYQPSGDNPGKKRLMELGLAKYPRALEAMSRRGQIYRQQMELLAQLEKQGSVFVVRPELATIRTYEQNYQRLRSYYEHGYYMMAQAYDSFCRFITDKEGEKQDAARQCPLA